MYIVFRSEDRPLSVEVGVDTVGVKLRNRQKGGFGLRFAGGGDTPDFGHALSNGTYFRAVANFG